MAVRSSGAKSSAGNKRSVKKAVSLAENKAVTAAKVDAGADKNSLKLDVNVFKEKIVHHLRCTIGTSEKKASKIALGQVDGATESDLRIHQDTDDGRTVYEGSIIYNEMEYEFEIDAQSGDIIDWSSESVYDD